jgi:hypothetical protein
VAVPFRTAAWGCCCFKANPLWRGRKAAAGVARSRKQFTRMKGLNRMTRLVTTAQDLVVSAIDLTRACTENELYLALLTSYSKGSQFVADYLCRATLAFQMQSAAETLPFDAFVARETFADLLMMSAPLSNSELTRTAEKAIREVLALRTTHLRCSQVRVLSPNQS